MTRPKALRRPCRRPPRSPPRPMEMEDTETRKRCRPQCRHFHLARTTKADGGAEREAVVASAGAHRG